MMSDSNAADLKRFGMTDEEIALWTVVAAAAGRMLALPKLHPMERDETATDFHRIQLRLTGVCHVGSGNLSVKASGHDGRRWMGGGGAARGWQPDHSGRPAGHGRGGHAHRWWR